MHLPTAGQRTLKDLIKACAAQGQYILRNLRLHSTVTRTGCRFAESNEFFLADVTVEHGKISAIRPIDSSRNRSVAMTETGIDVGGRIALPLFVDCHTHLDKGHILPRTTGADGTFAAALAETKADRSRHWTSEDLTRRMEFGLRCAYHHGTRAIRTHIDSLPPQDEISWPLVRELKEQWRDRIELQAACLFGIDLVRDEDVLERIARRVAEAGGVLGAVAFPTPDLDLLLDRMFSVADRFGLDLDFHADETGDPTADALERIADAALRNRSPSKVLVGHCCSLAMQDAARADETLDKVAAAELSIVSLPMCNLYLQDRRHDGTTPRWRGVTLLHEMRQRGIPVALASDNTRDPFHAYGDLDMMETYRLGTRILHLDHGAADWPRAVSATPADIMRLSESGMIGEGRSADLVLFDGRCWSELLARPEHERIVLRGGVPNETRLPSYAELDDLSGLAMI
jgi:cytosine deaminase